MKNTSLTLIISIFYCASLFSQVAIGTDTPAPGTALHIADSSGASGVLFPKVNITDVATVAPLPTGTQDGTIVYNTNSATGEGYYFFKDSRWEPIFGTVGGMAKFTNRVFSTGSDNLNDGGSDAEVFGSVYFNDNAVVFEAPTATPDADELTVREAGRYKVIINLALAGFSDSATDRRLLAVEARLRINGITVGGVYRSNEMISPDNTTPDYSSITITEIINLNANDRLKIRVSQTQDNGIVHLRSENSSSVFIERLD